MPYCQSCDDPTPMQPADGRAVCPLCGRSDPAPREPFLVVTGASGSGKTTVFAPLARELAGEAAVFDIDYLIDAFAIQAHEAPLNWRAIRAAWLLVAQGVAHSGLPTVLLGPLAPFHFDDLRQTKWVSSMHFFVLDCPEASGALVSRLALRGGSGTSRSRRGGARGYAKTSTSRARNRPKATARSGRR